MGTRLSKPPVFLVLCQIRHSPVLKLDALLPDFQDRLRKKGFPGYRANKQIGFEVTGDPAKQDDMKVTQQELTSHLLANNDESAIFVVAADSFTFQTTNYGDFESFRDVLAMGLADYQEVVGPALVTSMGVRFLDLVVPPEDQPVSHYVRREYLGLHEVLVGDWTGNYQFVESSLNHGDQVVKSRVVVRNSTVQLPPDLAGSVRKLPPRLAEVNGVHAVIDTDATFAPTAANTMTFGVEGITERMTSLKMDASEVFKSTVTPEALKAWE